MYVGLSAEIIPVKESNDKTPANIPAAIIGSRIGVIDSENKSNTAFIQPGHHRSQVAQRAAGRDHPGREHETRQRAVSGGAVLQEHDVTRLLSAEGVAAGLHVLEHVAVTDPGLAHGDALPLHGLEHAEVAHDGGDEGVVRQRALLAHRDGEDRHDLVAVDRRPGVVDGEAAVGVAVVGDPEVGALLDDGGLQHAEVGRPVAVVDVQPVGIGADDVDGGAGRAKRLG